MSHFFFKSQKSSNFTSHKTSKGFFCKPKVQAWEDLPSWHSASAASDPTKSPRSTSKDFQRWAHKIQRIYPASQDIGSLHPPRVYVRLLEHLGVGILSWCVIWAWRFVALSGQVGCLKNNWKCPPLDRWDVLKIIENAPLWTGGMS